MTETIYRVPPSYRRSMLAFALFWIAIGLALFAFRDASIAGIALALIVAGVLIGKHATSGPRHEVALTGSTIAIGGGAPVDLATIDEIRERTQLQRLELRRGGAVVAAIVYRLEDVEELVREVLRRVPRTKSAPPRVIRGSGRRSIALDVLFTLLVMAALTWLLRTRGALDAVICAALIVILAGEVRAEILALEIDDRALRIRRAFDTIEIARGEIAAVDIALVRTHGPSRLKTVVIRRDGRIQWIAIAGVPAVEIYDAIAAPCSASSSRSTER